MPYRMNYPATVAEVLDDRATFRPGTLRAVKALRRAKAWRGTPQEQIAKLHECLTQLAQVYGVTCPCLIHDPQAESHYKPAMNVIVLHRPSVVTLLHEFGHARGMDERRACRWSINLFRRVFPRSFARCRQVGHMLLRPEGGN